MKRKVMLPDGTKLDVIGQGTWNIAEDPARRNDEIHALVTGMRSDMTLIDTAEMYGEGNSETLIGEALSQVLSAPDSPLSREDLFIVSKVYPHNAGRDHIFHSCEQTLQRLGTDYLDLYLLHWRGSIPLAETVSCMEELVAMGKIRRWGVSNFDTDDMEELMSVPGGKNCAVNQVLYHLASRGIEYDLLPWMRSHHIPVMAYSPLAQGGTLRRGLMEHPAVAQVAAKHHASVSQILLAFVIRGGDIIAIPKSGQAVHTLDNKGAADIRLDAEDLAILNETFPAPDHKVPLDVI